MKKLTIKHSGGGVGQKIWEKSKTEEASTSSKELFKIPVPTGACGPKGRKKWYYANDRLLRKGKILKAAKVAVYRKENGRTEPPKQFKCRQGIPPTGWEEAGRVVYGGRLGKVEAEGSKKPGRVLARGRGEEEPRKNRE